MEKALERGVGYIVKFDHVTALTDFKRELTFAIKQLQEELLNEARQGMQTPEGAGDLSEGVIEVIGTLIMASIVGGGYALIDEWGSGSLMDTGNPALEEYRNSELWNPKRYDTAIRGRPAGTFPTMFGEQTFLGRAPGVNLEKLAEEGKADDKYLPHPPSHAVQTAMRWMANGRMQEVIRQVVMAFPWHRYILTGRGGG